MSVKFDAGYCPRCDKKVMSFKQAIGLAGHAAHFVATMMATPFWGVVWVAHMIDTAFRPWLCAQCGTKTSPYTLEHIEKEKQAQETIIDQ